jgi:hypothetical protein
MRLTIPVAARSKAWGRLVAGVAGSNPDSVCVFYGKYD